eukprot:CAMPEP_0197894914 /NCGR_PEP_ID=MMETSP1439-20131203/36082_1 /TAXON_ID=66791 /ORGANISM="Gonyaulax spinifera, Strain CCMP409" /LENGTH=159 /DNA_ID=CAMNT_0043515301 /DNA_START=106 /DNA_END=582 /DNA_ORIENTATION=+
MAMRPKLVQETAGAPAFCGLGVVVGTSTVAGCGPFGPNSFCQSEVMVSLSTCCTSLPLKPCSAAFRGMSFSSAGVPGTGGSCLRAAAADAPPRRWINVLRDSLRLGAEAEADSPERAAGGARPAETMLAMSAKTTLESTILPGLGETQLRCVLIPSELE